MEAPLPPPVTTGTEATLRKLRKEEEEEEEKAKGEGEEEEDEEEEEDDFDEEGDGRRRKRKERGGGGECSNGSSKASTSMGSSSAITLCKYITGSAEGLYTQKLTTSLPLRSACYICFFSGEKDKSGGEDSSSYCSSSISQVLRKIN